METSLIVVDDFYKDPEAVRKLALSADFEDVRSLNYPGFQSLKAYYSQGLVERFAEILGEEVIVDHSKASFGRFRAMLASTGSRIKVHVDGEVGWTGLIYLNEPRQCDGGTAFYQHLPTGLFGPPTTPEGFAEHGCSDWQDFDDSIVARDSLDPDKWRQVDFVGMEFNRLVLFRGDQVFHAHTSSFGTDLHDARLTQNFFFDTPQTIRSAA